MPINYKILEEMKNYFEFLLNLKFGVYYNQKINHILCLHKEHFCIKKLRLKANIF